MFPNSFKKLKNSIKKGLIEAFNYLFYLSFLVYLLITMLNLANLPSSKFKSNR